MSGAGEVASIADTGTTARGRAPRAVLPAPCLALVAALALALLAPGAAPAAECENEALRAAQGSAALPDCRAYELVTPAAKDAAEPFGALTTEGAAREAAGVKGARAGVDGERLAWFSEYALPGSALLRPYEAGTPGLQYLSKRSPGGWVSEDVVPPQSVEYGLLCQPWVGVVGWSPDLGRGVLADGRGQEGPLSFQDEGNECGRDEPLLAAAQPAGFEERPGFQNLFVRDDEGSGYRLVNVTPSGAPHPAPSPGEYREYFPASFLAGSDDLGHVVFEEELPLTEEAERTSPEVEEACAQAEPGCWQGRDNLYEWSEEGTGGTVRLVTILPDGTPVEGMLAGATRNGGGGRGGTPPELLTPNVANFRHAVSADGSRIFFEAAGGLYVREEGSETVQVDAARSGLPGASDGGGTFMAASADGSRVFFSDDASHLLTADTVPGSGANLYECDLPAASGQPCELTNLTAGPEAGVLGVSGTNQGTQNEEEAGGSYVYFVARGALSAGDPAAGSVPVPGQPNLYVHHGGANTFIATLDGTESGETPAGAPCTKSSAGGCFVTYGDSCDWTSRGGCEFHYETGSLKSATGVLSARVSRNGRFIAFDSTRSLTGYDNEDAASALPGEVMDAQVFVYDAGAGRLSCASCNPDATVRPTAPTTIAQAAATYGGPTERIAYPQRNLSDDGAVFFESLDPLLPEDTGGGRSLYEYDGTGLHLISSGASETESIFLDASPDGSDVFFISADPLLGRDGDTSFDVYDARVGGGFPEPAQPAPPCESEADCRAAATAAPVFPAPATADFAGPGNEHQAHALRAGKRKRLRRHRRRRGHRHHAHGKRHGKHPAAAGASSVSSGSSGSPAAPTAAGTDAEAEKEVVEPETAPHAVTEEAQEVTTTSALLRGKVYKEVVFNSPKCVAFGLVCENSGGTPIKACRFELASAATFEQGGSYDRQAPCEPPPPYPETNSVEIVAAALAGLEPHVTYHYRLLAENEAGQVGVGEDRTFTTLGSYEKPAIDGEGYAIERQPDGGFVATLNARVNPHGFETTCQAQYVADDGYRESGFADATTIPCAPPTLPVGFGDEEVSASTGELPAGGRYHFRFLARNQEGETVGEERTLVAFSIEEFAAAPTRLQENPPGGFGQPYELLDPQPQDLLAGGHPYELNETLRLSTASESPWGASYPSFAVVNAKDIVATLPAGLIGNPLAVPACPEHEVIHATCDGAAQVGVLRLEGNRRQAGTGQAAYWEVPLYNLVPPPGMPAQLGAPLPKPSMAIAHVDAGVGPGSGYAVGAAALNSTAAEGLISVTATIWGVPHDPGHDPERFCPAPEDTEAPSAAGGECPADAELEADLRPFLRNPTSCEGAAAARMEVDAWQGPGDFVAAADEYPQMTGCASIPFEPTIALAPTAASADSPTGLRVDLELPQPESADGVGEADLRRAVVELPPGLQVNPASADGLEACAPDQIDLHGEGPARCPDGSKIGRVEVETPLVDHPLRGGVYVATPGRNPFGTLLAIYLAVDDPRTGVVVKLAGKVEADPQSGQLTTTFDDSPQVPFERFRIDFFAGPRAALKTPASCGTFTATTRLTPWSAPEGADATPSDAFQIGSGPGGGACPGSAEQAPNQPRFSAGTLSPAAGAYSPFVLRLDRADGDQALSAVAVTLPPGLTGRLAGVPSCPEEAIAAAATRDGREEIAHPDCPAASQVGRVTVAAGAGPTPHYVEGRVYLAGPHAGAPLSLAIVTPAVAGPFDLGTVVVRSLLYVDPETARIRAVSEPMPQMLQGIPLDVRSIVLELDRPRFTLNPTSCEPMAIEGTAVSALDRAAPLASGFQVGGCDALPFAPTLSLSLTGAMRHAGHPALKAVVTAPVGQANIAGAQVSLPPEEFLAQEDLQTICTRVQFKEGGGHGERCPPESIYGTARARTPLLDQPLEGPVLLRASSNPLPDLVAVLGGRIDVVLDARIDSYRHRMRTTFDLLPDAPIETFTMEMPGGARGLLTNSEDLCGQRLTAIADFTAQNGRVFDSEPVVATSCRGVRKKHHRRKRHRKRRHHRAHPGARR